MEPWTLKVYEQFVRNHIAPAMGGLTLSELSPARVREFRDIDMLGAGKSRYLTGKILTALSSICSDAVADEFLGVNPCKGIRLITNKREKIEVTIPTKDQIRTIMEIAERWAYGTSKPLTPGLRGPVVFKGISRWRALWWFTFLRMLIATGCRSSEIRGASWEALRGHKFVVKQRADNSGIIGAPKSASSWRELDLDPGTIEVLNRWRPVAPKGKDNLIFAGKMGRPEALSNISKRLWFPMLCEAGIAKRVRTPDGGEKHETPFTLHDLRHFHASLMIEAGLRDKALQEHMGHSSIQVTMDIYGHLFVDEDSKAARRRLVTGATAGLLGATAREEVARLPPAKTGSVPVVCQSEAKNEC